MTMQRIDENTYIDDSLVTCAEYQLFIDEMRKQGKYYQPDHWTSYQFSVGQAREPILGVRYSDAMAFSKWWTRKNSNDWKFRLPTQEEKEPFPVKYHGNSLLGYWLNEAGQFAWIGPVPINARQLDHSPNLVDDIDFDIDRAIDQATNRARNLALDLDLDRNIDRDFNLDLEIESAVSRKIVSHRNIQQGGICALIFYRARTHKRGFNLARALDIYIDLFTLDRRIGGGSPAFEGIRLVKYREP